MQKSRDGSARVDVLLHVVVVDVHHLAPRAGEVEVLRHVRAGSFDREAVRHGHCEVLRIRHVTEQFCHGKSGVKNERTLRTRRRSDLMSREASHSSNP